MSQPNSKRYLPGPKVATRYDVTDMSIYRWERDPRLNFPAPIRIGRRKFWDEDELEAWERARPRQMLAEAAVKVRAAQAKDRAARDATDDAKAEAAVDDEAAA